MALRAKQGILAGLFRTPFASAFGYLGLATGIRSLIHPAFNPVAMLLGGWQAVWAVAFGLGGLLMLLGLALWKPKVEAAGISLFIGGLMVQAVAFIVIPDFSRSVGWPTVVNLGIFALFSAVRLVHILRGQSLVWVSTTVEVK